MTQGLSGVSLKTSPRLLIKRFQSLVKLPVA